MNRSIQFRLIVLACLLGGSSARSQVSMPESQPDRPIFGLGVSAGVASGFGLSFRYHAAGRFSYEFVGGIIKASRTMHYNFGTEVQYDIGRNERARFFACGAVGYFYSGERRNDLDGPARFGFGIGGETGTSRSINLSGEFLFTFFSDGTVLPLPQVGIHFYFL